MTDKSNETLRRVIKPDSELIEKTKTAVRKEETAPRKGTFVTLRKCAFAAAVFAVVCLAVSGTSKKLSQNSQTRQSSPQTTLEETANSVVNAADEITKVVPARQSGAVNCNSNTLDIMAPIRTDEEKFNRPDVTVIRGTVVKSHYVLGDKETVYVYTKSKVKVLKCYKGSLSEGDTVTVKENGGFIPSDIYENAIHREKYGTDAAVQKEPALLDIRSFNYKVLEEGEDVILFLVPYTLAQADEFKGECYEPLRFWQGKLLFNEKEGAYIPYVPEDMLSDVVAKTYTLEEFEAFAAEQIKGK